MEVKFYGTRSNIEYMKNYFLHPDSLNLMRIIKSVYICEHNDQNNGKEYYRLSYEDHTGKIRRSDGRTKTVIKTKIPQDLIRFLEKNAEEIEIDHKRGDFAKTPRDTDHNMAEMDPKHWKFFKKDNPKLRRELIAIIILLQDQRDFPIVYEELLVQSAKKKRSIFCPPMEFEPSTKNDFLV